MRVFLRILYGDRIEVDETFPSLVLHLLSLATRYDVKHIGNSLISCIDQNLVVESAVHTLQCAYQWDSEYPELKPKVLAFIAKNINSVFKNFTKFQIPGRLAAGPVRLPSRPWRPRPTARAAGSGC